MLIPRDAPADIAAALRIERPALEQRIAGILARVKTPISLVP